MYIYSHDSSSSNSHPEKRQVMSQTVQRNGFCSKRGMEPTSVSGGNNSTYRLGNAGLEQLTSADQVKKLMKELQPIFQKKFSKNRITYGPLVGKSVRFRVVADKDFKAEVEQEAKRLANSILPITLKFAPEIVWKKLQAFYKANKEPFPTRLQTIDENTKLTREEKVAIFTLLEVLTVKKATDDADKVAAFYSPSMKEIVFRDSEIDAGTVAHEMAHAYANQGWHDFINLMRLRGMGNTHELDEGMTTFIERTIVQKWHLKQPSNTTIPLPGYDSKFTDRAQEFIKQLGQDVAFEAYFGGWIDFTNNAKPEDTLKIGNKNKKKWTWPWRESKPQQTGLQGFAQTPPLSEHQRSLDAILRVLRLNPVGGYVKGSSARRQLEEAFESVPPCSALELAQKLLKSEGTLEKLFRHRLATPTRQVVLQILIRKAKECQVQKKEELRLKEERHRKDEERRQLLCKISRTSDRLVEEFCRNTGEDSECRKLRSEAVKEREQFRMKGIHCP